MEALERLLKPRHVAVVGASGDAAKTSGRPLHYLARLGFSGSVYPVNPRYRTIGGLACYPDVASLPCAPDAALVLLGAERAEEAVRQLAERGARSCIVVAGGYRELGAEGALRQERLRQAAGAMRLLGPNTIGVVNVIDRVTLSASGALEGAECPAGSIGVVSQSGGILGALLSRAAGLGIGCSRLIATGNEADLDVCDGIEYLMGDPATAVITVYLEGLRSPARFRDLALEAARRGKPVVAYKVGRSEAGARSVASHTGALAGTDSLYDALFRQCGVIRAQRFASLLDLPAALASGRRLRGKRVAVLTSTGGAGTLLADCCALAGFELPAPDPATVERLRAAHPDPLLELSQNPIDVTLAGAQPAFLRDAIRALIGSPGCDALVVVVGSSALGRPEAAARAIADGLAGSEKPLLAYVSPGAPHILADLNRRSIPAFAAPESCAEALDALWRAAAPPTALSPPPPFRPAPPPEALPAGLVDEARSLSMLSSFGIPTVRHAVAATAREAAGMAGRFGASVVLKALSRRISHKTDVGAVRIGVPAAQVAEAAQALWEETRRRSGFEPDGLLVQEQITGGIELLLGFRRDPVLGGALMVGAGGVAAEVLADTAVRLLPIGRVDARGMLEELRIWPLLRGFRGQAGADLEGLISVILSFAVMVDCLGESLLEAEVNPLFALPDRVCAADALMVLKG
jgi:acyl-CoA synthetase (NDP forming)